MQCVKYCIATRPKNDNLIFMATDDQIIEKAKIRIGDLDQLEISKQDSIDVRVSINEGGKFQFYSVRFYRERVGDKYIWDYPEIIER